MPVFNYFGGAIWAGILMHQDEDVVHGISIPVYVGKYSNPTDWASTDGVDHDT